MEDGGWRMEDGGWGMEDGGWRIHLEFSNSRMFGAFQRDSDASSTRVQRGKARWQEAVRVGKRCKVFVNKPRIVTIHAIDNLTLEFPLVQFSMRSSKATYVRSVARDLGQMLGCGGYVWTLRRTAIGSFDVENAVTLGECKEMFGVREAA